MSKHDGATICFWEEGLKYLDPELVDSFVENKNSDISHLSAQIYILFVTMWVCKIKGKNRSSRYQVGPLNVWTFMKFIPGLHTTWHMCVFHDQYKLTNDVLHITLCVDIIRFPLEFAFEFIWIFQNINNKRFQDFSLK